MTHSPYASTQDIGRKGNSRVFIEWRALTCPKAEFTAETIEDRWAANSNLGLFAVADGVGSSYHAADWAQALVDAWVKTPFTNKFAFEVEWWVRQIQPGFAISEEAIAKLQPSSQEQARRGAGSTLLGLRLWPASDNKSALYQLLCVGDSDMLHYPKATFPISSPESFGSYPTVLRSKGFDRKQDIVLRFPEKDKLPENQRAHTPLMRLQQSDLLMLCTDAIAKWALDADRYAYYHDDAEDARTQLERQTPATWQGFVERLRHEQNLVDDDTTILFIRTPKDQRAPATNQPNADGWVRSEVSYQEISRAEDTWKQERRAEMDTLLARPPVSAIEVARVFGDGRYFTSDAIIALAEQGRARATALDQINEALRGISWDRPTRDQLGRLQALRAKYGQELGDEPAARGALNTINDLLSRPVEPTPPQPAPQTRPALGAQAPTLPQSAPEPMQASLASAPALSPDAPVNPASPANDSASVSPTVAAQPTNGPVEGDS